MVKTRNAAIHYNPHCRPERQAEVPGTQRIVETAGFRTTKQQVNEYLNAGRRLGDYRRMTYDFEDPDKVDEDYEDITRTPGYDPADATADLRTAEENLRESAKKKKQKLEAEKAEEEFVPDETVSPEDKVE